MTGQVYPGATRLLGEAFDALDRLRRRLDSHVEGDPSDIVITTDQDGAGRIMVYPTGGRGTVRR